MERLLRRARDEIRLLRKRNSLLESQLAAMGAMVGTLNQSRAFCPPMDVSIDNELDQEADTMEQLSAQPQVLPMAGSLKR